MPSHDPSRPRKARRRRSSSARAAFAVETDLPAEQAFEEAPPAHESSLLENELTEWRLVGNVEDWAPVLMSTNYSEHLALEDAAATEQRGAVAELFEPSSYRVRLSGENLDRYDRRTADRQRDSVAHLRRSRNQRSWTFSILARTVSWFTQRVPHRVWHGESRAARVASHPTVVRLLDPQNCLSSVLLSASWLHPWPSRQPFWSG